MMNNLEKKYLIKGESLNATYYFQSILQEASRLKLLTDSEFEKIQMQSILLLTNQADRYTNGESSSLNVETSQEILQSLLYCIGVYLKTLSDTDRIIDVLKNKPLLELYQNGKKLIRMQLETAKKLYNSIKKDILVTDNCAYNDTIHKGIQMFFSAYDVDTAAHDTPASIDYPLSNDKMDLVGIEYITDYLQKLSLENQFCKYFTEQDIHCLLRGYDDHYQDLLINIFGLVLTNALGSILANKNTQLRIEPSDRKFLQQKLADLSKDNLNTILQDASKKLCLELDITDNLLQKHIIAFARNLSAKLKNALENDQLELMFVSLKEELTQPVFKFEDGKKMSDEQFRRIANEIRECRFVSDKIEIIQREVHSITDLADILEGYCIFDNEFAEVFQSLSDMELALLLKKLPTHLIDSNHHYTQNEKEWHNGFDSFLKEIDTARREIIIDLADKIDLGMSETVSMNLWS